MKKKKKKKKNQIEVLPVLASLIGNDYINEESIIRIHQIFKIYETVRESTTMKQIISFLSNFQNEKDVLNEFIKSPKYTMKDKKLLALLKDSIQQYSLHDIDFDMFILFFIFYLFFYLFFLIS